MNKLKTPQSSSNLKDFEFLGKLGQGSFGVVYKVRRKVDSKHYVMKQINISKMNSRMKADAINEVTILSKLIHQNIVKYYDSFIDRNLLNIVMEFCESGDLSQLLKSQFGRPLKEDRIWKYFIQMTIGLEYIHKRKILHRDIKTMNVFLQKDEVRIGDLGVAKVLEGNMDFARTMVGTPFYLSPEMCEEKPYNEKSDIWALGCVLYEMCTYKHPFEAKTQGALILRIIRGKYNPIPTSYSRELIEMVDLLLRRDYKSRPNATQILAKTSVQKKAESLSISLQPVSSGPIEYKKKESAPSSAANSSNQLDKKKPTHTVEKNQKIKNIQAQIVSERNQVPSTPANQKKKENDYMVKPSAVNNLKYKDPTSQQNNGNNYQHYRNNEQPPRPQAGIPKKRIESAAVVQQQQKNQNIINNKQQEKDKKPILNAYNDKQIGAGAVEATPARKKIIQKEPVPRQQPKIQSNAFMLEKQLELNNRNKQQSEPSAVSQLNSQQQYPFTKQANLLKKKENSDQSSKQQQIQQQQVNKSKQVSSNNTPKSSLLQQPFQSQLHQAYQKRHSERELVNPKEKEKEDAIKFPYNKKPAAGVVKSEKQLGQQNVQSGERDNIGRIRKGAPQQLARQAQQPQIKTPQQNKQLFGVNNVKDSEIPLKKPEIIKQQNPSNNFDQKDYDEVMNLPDDSDEDDEQESQQQNNNQQQQQQKNDPDYEKVFGRKLHNEQDVVKCLDKHLGNKKEEENNNNSNNNNDSSKNSSPLKSNEKSLKKGQQVVSDQFIEDEFASSDSEKEDKKQNKQKIIKEEEEEEIQKFVPKKQPMDLQSILQKEKKKPAESEEGSQEDESTQINNNQDDEEEEEEEFTVQHSQLNDQEDGENEEDDQQQDENEEDGEDQNQQEEEDSNEDQAYYDDEEEEDDDDEEQNDEENEENNSEEDENEDEEEEKKEQEEIQEEDEEEEEVEEEDMKLKTQDVQRTILEKRFDDTKKRQDELQQLLDTKVSQGIKSLGNDQFMEILAFFRSKLNSDQELSNEDQEDIDDVIQKHIVKHHNPQLIYTIYKILHLEIQLDKSKEKLAELRQKIELCL